MARPEGLEPPTPRFVVWCSDPTELRAQYFPSQAVSLQKSDATLVKSFLCRKRKKTGCKTRIAG